MEMEQLQDQSTEVQCRLKIEQLKEVCIQAKVSLDKEKRHRLIRAINKTVDTAFDEEEHVAETFVHELLATAKRLRETAPKSKSDVQNEEELQSLQKQ